MDLETWWRISGPRWTFAVIDRDGVVADAAPISAWAIGRPIESVIGWWKKKGAVSVERLSA